MGIDESGVVVEILPYFQDAVSEVVDFVVLGGILSRPFDRNLLADFEVAADSS